MTSKLIQPEIAATERLLDIETIRSEKPSEPSPSLEQTAPSTARRAAAYVASILTILFTLRYILWRCAINNWHNWWLSCPLLAAEIFTAMHILGYQYTVWPRRKLATSSAQNPYALPVFIFIPTVNEGASILGPTIRGAIETRRQYVKAHPDASVRIVVCNDGRVANASDWQSTDKLAQQRGVECVTRTVGGGAKAGNIENARRIVGADGDCLIVVLDADQIARPDFLLRAIEPFADPTVGWVQTRQFYRNQESRIARWAEAQASLFYDFVCPGKAAVNASFICGTNVVISAQVLDQIGGFPQDSITEDFAASIRTHHQWRSVYIQDVLAEGLGPMDLTAYYVQQSRWARGTIGVLLTDGKRLVLPGFTMRQRIQYLLSGTHYLCGLRDFIFLGSAVLCLVTARSPVQHVTLASIASYLLPYIIATQALICIQSGVKPILRSMIIGYSSFPILVVSLIEALTNRRVAFIVTPKSESMHSDLRAIVPHIVVVVVCLAALAYATTTHTAWTIKCIPFFWVTYALTMLLPTFVLAKLTPTRIANRG